MKRNIVIIALSTFLVFFSQPIIKANTEKAANFSLRDPWNYKFSLDDFRGKTVILNFFRIYCHGRMAPETVKQIEQLSVVCEKVCKGVKCAEGDIQIISITFAACPTTDLKEFTNELGIKWLLGNDYDDYIPDIFSSYSKYLSKIYEPALIFINKDGEVVYTSSYLSSSEILEKLKEIQSVSKEKVSEEANK